MYSVEKTLHVLGNVLQHPKKYCENVSVCFIALLYVIGLHCSLSEKV